MPRGRLLRPGGISEYFGPDGIVTKHSSTCFHCQSITEFDSLKEMHEHVDVCRQCFHLICLACVGKPCRPWELQMERHEARGRFLRDAGLA